MVQITIANLEMNSSRGEWNQGAILEQQGRNVYSPVPLLPTPVALTERNLPMALAPVQIFKNFPHPTPELFALLLVRKPLSFLPALAIASFQAPDDTNRFLRYRRKS